MFRPAGCFFPVCKISKICLSLRKFSRYVAKTKNHFLCDSLFELYSLIIHCFRLKWSQNRLKHAKTSVIVLSVEPIFHTCRTRVQEHQSISDQLLYKYLAKFSVRFCPTQKRFTMAGLIFAGALLRRL